MATGTISPTSVPPPPPVAESRERERVIQRQLGRTSLYVRLVDLAGRLAFWAVGVLAFFILAALIDHVIGLRIVGRVVALLLLTGGSAWYLVAVIWPLLVRGINPTYAARTIEDATPSLKNSLINFLLLRQDRSQIKEIVFEAVERKAASDIASVPVESTVDRTALIRAGYVLCGAMALLAAYKILSPKDPFQTVARVLAPWAEIARPSRVQIEDVQPGDAEVYHGTTQTVSAIVQGVRDGDPVTLLVSTADGQTVDQPVEMSLAPGGLRYQCVLPPRDAGPADLPAGGSAAPFAGLSPGLQQDLTYRIVAGDAESLAYKLTVVAAPTIIVERLEYEFPPYTKKPAEKVERRGDIRALEGTKVTIRAVANQPIKSAWIEFDPNPEGAPQLVPLATEGTRAWGTITLELQRDRQTPWHKTYQVRFRNAKAQRSEQPILHKLEVIPDLSPEVQILQPQRIRVEVPENGTQTIEVRAIDPDFSLSAVRLEGTAGNKPPLKVDLLPAGASELPQITVPYVFRPSDHKLAAGDELKYVAVAEDNRVNALTGAPDPNTARTKEYTLVVVEPAPNQDQQQNPNQQPMAGGQANQDPKNQDPKNQDPKNQDPKNDGQQSPMGGSPMAGGAGGHQGGNPEQTNPMAGGGAGEQTNQGNPDNQAAGNDQQQADPNAGAAGQTTGQGGKPQGKAHDGQAIEEALNDLQRRGQQPAGQQQPAGNQGQNENTGQPMPEPDQQNRDGQGQNNQSQRMAPGGQPQDAGNSGNQGQNTPTTGAPAGNQAERNVADQEQSGQGPRDKGQKAKAGQRLPDEQKGDNPSEQQGEGGKGGAPQGPDQTAQQPKSKTGEGERRDPGAGQNSDPGAGEASEDKSGSGTGQEANRDRPKEQQPMSNTPKGGETSAASGSKHQSDSKGGESGDQSGGGKQGAGQGAGQKGNDSSGGNSAGDQGAGRAEETGSGETGAKAGSQQKADGKTGKAGTQQGQGSTSKSGNEGDAADSDAGQEGKSGKASSNDASQQASKSQNQSSQPGSRGGKGGGGPVVEGGGDDRLAPPDPRQEDAEAADAANLEYSRKATELALKHLKEEEHNPDPDLLDKLGWTKDDLAEFLRRWDALQKSAQQSPEGQRELDEALRSLGLRDPANRRRSAGGTVGDSQRDLRDGGNRSAPPAAFREFFDAFRKGAARTAP